VLDLDVKQIVRFMREGAVQMRRLRAGAPADLARHLNVHQRSWKALRKPNRRASPVPLGRSCGRT
jgi:hypothetical protein